MIRTLLGSATGAVLALCIAGSSEAASPARTPPPPPPPPPPPAFLSTTITDIGRPYTVVDAACVFQAFPKTATAGDPLEEAMAQAFSRAREITISAGANGFIGLDVDFTSPAGKEPGRLLLCGTVVKIR